MIQMEKITNVVDMSIQWISWLGLEREKNSSAKFCFVTGSFYWKIEKIMRPELQILVQTNLHFDQSIDPNLVCSIANKLIMCFCC